MAIIAGVGTSNFTNSTTASITVPSDVVAGDVLLIAFALNNQQSVTVRPSQLTLVGSNPFIDTTQGTSEIYYGIVDQSTITAGTVLSWTLSVTRACVITLQAYSGVDNSNPIHKIANAISTSTNSVHTAPIVTTTITSHIAESFYGKASASSPTLSVITPPSNFVATQEKFATGTYNIGISAAAIPEDVAPGTYGGDTWTANTTTNPESLWTIALKPATLAENYTSSVSLNGIGTLSAIGTVRTVATVARNGSGTLSTSVVPKTATTSLLSSSGALSSTQSVINLIVSTGLTGSGLQTSTSTISITISKAFTGTGTLTSASNLSTFGINSINGSGTLTVTGNTNQIASISINGTGTLSAAQTNITQKSNVSFSGTGFTGFQTITSGLAPFNSEGVGELSGEIDALSISNNIDVAGSGSLTAQSKVAFNENISFGSSSNLVSDEVPNIEQDGNLTNTGTLSGEIKNISQNETTDLHGAGFLGFQTGSSGNSSFVSDSIGNLSVEVSIAFVRNVNLNSSGELVPDPGKFAQNSQVFVFGSGALSTDTKPEITETVDLNSIGILSVVASAETNESTTIGLSSTGVLSANNIFIEIIDDDVQLSSNGTLSSSAPINKNGSVYLASSGTLSAASIIDRPEQIELATVVMNSRQYNGSIINNSYQGVIIHRMYSATINTSQVFIIKFNPPKRLDR